MKPSVQVTANRRYGSLSPLRYPGGKASLAGVFSDVIRDLDIRNATYVEPYAGGAGAAIALLREGVVDRVVINDIDPAVHAFWCAVTQDNEAFIDRVGSAPLTIDEWLRQRDVYRAKDISDPLALGFAFFYLNRTNRSGVLNAGVIGGLDQSGNYKMDARFNRETLTARLKTVGDFAGQIEVSDLDGRSVIRNYASRPDVFLYIDPPYVQAGSQLYLNAFDGRDHQALAAAVDQIEAAHWLITYDVAPLVQNLYRGHFQCLLELNYSARHPGRAEELLVASPHVATALSRLHLARVAASA